MEQLLILHGAIGSATQMAPIANRFKTAFDVLLFNLYGHGGKPIDNRPFSIPLFANEVLSFLDENNIANISIFGYSMGGYIALYLAKHHPDRISRIVTLATKFDWNEQIAAKEIQMLNPEKIAIKLPAFANTLAERFAPADWKQALQKTADMMVELGVDNTLKTNDYADIATPVLVLLGDRDKMVSLDETLSVYKSLPNAQLGILPNTHHPIEQVDADLLFAMSATLLLKK